MTLDDADGLALGRDSLKKEAASFRRYVAEDHTFVNTRGVLGTKADLLAGVERNIFTKYVEDKILFTDTFIRRNGQWQMVASHSTVAAPQSVVRRSAESHARKGIAQCTNGHPLVDSSPE